MKIVIKAVLFGLALFLTASCALKTIPPEQQYRQATMPAPFSETYKLIRPCLIKFNYNIVNMDITVGTIQAVSKRNHNKYLTVTVSEADSATSNVKLKLDVRKQSMTGEYKRVPVPEKYMQELDDILNEIKRRATLIK